MTARRTTIHDEGAFIELLTSVYGRTYSYRGLYEPGGFRGLLESGIVLSFGDFDESGCMVSHTAFLLKDLAGEYVESGMSFRRPGKRLSVRSDETAIWPTLFQAIPAGTAYMHQNTTTFHPLAQRYAERHLKAVPTGFIANYAVGEVLTGVSQPNTPMLALTLTTGLLPSEPARVAFLPDTPWTSWISIRLQNWNRTITEVPAFLRAPMVETFEQNSWIGLRRSVVKYDGPAHVEPKARVDLIHLPLDERAGFLSILLTKGYLPVGVRIHQFRPDEAVLQHFGPDQISEAASAMGAAKLHSNEAKNLISSWLLLCNQLS